MPDLTDILEQLRDRLQTAEADLVTAKEAASRIPEIDGEIERIQAAMKALGAPQTPAGRRRISDAQTKRPRKPKGALAEPAPTPTPVAQRKCSVCHLPFYGGDAAGCPEAECEAVTHALECAAKHQRWHAEAGA